MAEKREPRYMDFGISSMEMVPAYLTGTDEDVVDALAISREYAQEAKLDDNDSVEDSLRHILFGGLIYGDPEKEGMIGKAQRGLAGYLGDVKEGKDPESLIDLNNNEFGRKLRQQYPDREEFIAKAKEVANALATGKETPEIDGLTIQKSYGNLTQEEIDRLTEEAAKPQMDEGGLMADPLTLSETVEEEESPKMSVGEYAEGVRDFAVDLTPSGTADAIIETGKALSEGEYGKAAMSALGAIPGGKTASKVAGKLDVPDDTFKKLQAEWMQRTGKKPNTAVTERNPVMESKAAEVKEGLAEVGEFRKIADEQKPVRVWDEVPEPATYEDMFFALDAKKRTKPFLGYDLEVEDGVRTTSRLDIPAYTGFDTWVVTLKGGKDFAEGSTAYAPAVRLKNVDLFQDKPKQMKSLKIAAGAGKGPHAVMEGDYVKESVESTYKAAQQAIKDEDWVQVGYDPTRRGFFYDRKTMEPVVSAEEVLQVGPLVLAKGAKKGKAEDFEFNAGGLMSDAYNRAES